MGMVVWQDRQIDPGEKWHPAIQDAMADAVAAVLLISADYLASGFCVKEEVPYLLDRQEREGMLLVPVLIRKCPWKAHVMDFLNDHRLVRSFKEGRVADFNIMDVGARRDVSTELFHFISWRQVMLFRTLSLLYLGLSLISIAAWALLLVKG